MNWLRRLFGRRRLESELERELRFHLERQTAHLERAGLSKEEAARQTRLQFGGGEQVREECRDARGTRWLETACADVRLALRGLRKSPGFTATAVGMLALGIGANAAIFSLLDAVRLRSLPVPRPQQLALVQIEGGNPGFGITEGPRFLSYAVWERILEQQHGFSGVFAWNADGLRIGSGESARPAKGLWISGGFFSALEIAPAGGRLFRPQDDRRGCGTPGAVISYGFWQSEFGGRPSVIGSTLLIQDRPTEVLGITARGFRGLEPGTTFDVALPICSIESYSSTDTSLRRTDVSFLTVMGRLKPGWTVARATSQLRSISPGIFAATLPTGYENPGYRAYKGFRLAAYSAANGVSNVRDSYDRSLWLLLGITALVLLIACANLANLILVRAARREREMAVRLALGASRGRLIRQLLTESLLLALTGALFGGLIGQLLTRAILLLVATESDAPQLDLSLDWRLLAFMACVAIGTCLVFGLAPAFRGSRVAPGAAIKAGARGMTADKQQDWLRRALVAGQMAVSLVLLVGAILFVRSFWNLVTLDPGFREQGIVVMSLDLSRTNVLRGAQRQEATRRLLADLRAIPQVEAAATSSHVPLDGSSWTLAFDAAATKGAARFTWASPGYFDLMGRPLLAGRGFTDRDTAGAPHVAVVNQAFVRQFLRAENPLGRTLRTRAEPNYPATAYQIVGVVTDAKYASLREAVPPEVFGPAEQFPEAGMSPSIFLRFSSSTSVGIAAVRSRLRQSAPGAHTEFQVFKTRIRDCLQRERLLAVLAAAFGILAAFLSAMGLYGVISFGIASRRKELGIRLALGAGPGQIVGTILGPAARLALLGMGAGMVVAFLVSAATRSLLFGIAPSDPVTFAAAAALLTIVALTASLLPAWRASHLEASLALREE